MKPSDRPCAPLKLMAMAGLVCLIAACATGDPAPPQAPGSSFPQAGQVAGPTIPSSPSGAPGSANRSGAASPATPAPPPVMKIADAIQFAAQNLFRNAPVPGDADTPYPLVIDPLIDGNSGIRSQATEAMGSSVGAFVKANVPRFRMLPFTSANLAARPMLFIGTLTPVDAQGGNAGSREWYRVCLALVDLKTGKIVSKGFARASPEGINHAPTPFFEEQPAWSPDAATSGYVRTCQGTSAGDAIKPEYWDRLLSGAMINEAIAAYEKGRYREALDLYQALLTSGAQQLRVLNGLYLAHWKLGHQREAARAFGDIVDYGLANKRLAVKFLFRPGSTAFVPDRRLSASYPVWLSELAKRTQDPSVCLEISGHTSKSGAEPLNLRLSQMRAQAMRERLLAGRPRKDDGVQAIGKGSSEALSGLGTDDSRDALDRRVEFKPVECRRS